MGTYFHRLPIEILSLIDWFVPTSRARAQILAKAAVKVKLPSNIYCSTCGEPHKLPETCKQYDNKIKMIKACVLVWQAFLGMYPRKTLLWATISMLLD